MRNRELLALLVVFLLVCVITYVQINRNLRIRLVSVAQGHNTMIEMRLEPGASGSQALRGKFSDLLRLAYSPFRAIKA